MDFEIVSEITAIEPIAKGKGVRGRSRLRRLWWQSLAKLKGVAQVRLSNGRIRKAEIHWYQGHGVGRREFKIKLPFLDSQ